MHVYIAGMLCQTSICDIMFGSVRISGFPKSMDDLICAYYQDIVSTKSQMLMYACISPKKRKACV
jgi:hypothetical protein